VSAARVELRGVSKHFGGVRAVEAVSASLHAGEVLALVGHNGAGKSTLMQLLAGALAPDAGEIRVDGRAVRLRTPRTAQRLGIAALYQDLALADNLSAAANVFLGHELCTRWGTLDDARMERAARASIERLEPGFDRVRTPVGSLSGGERQLVAIARALALEARVLLMDEPTAALGPEEAARVAALVRRLKHDGLAVLLVSHDLAGVFELADRVAVMRGGRLVATRAIGDTTRDEVVRLIVGGRAD